MRAIVRVIFFVGLTLSLYVLAQEKLTEPEFIALNEEKSQELLARKDWAQDLEKMNVGKSFVWVVKPGVQSPMTEFALEIRNRDPRAKILFIPALEDRLNRSEGYRLIPYTGTNASDNFIRQQASIPWFDAYAPEGSLIVSASWLEHFRPTTLTAIMLMTMIERQVSAKNGDFSKLQASIYPENKVAQLDFKSGEYLEAVSLENIFMWIIGFRELILTQIWNEEGIMAGETPLSPEKLALSRDILKNLIHQGLVCASTVQSIFERWQILSGPDTKLNDIDLMVQKKEGLNQVVWATFFEKTKWVYQPQYVMWVPLGLSSQLISEEEINQELIERLSVIKDAAKKYKLFYEKHYRELLEFDSDVRATSTYIDWLRQSFDPISLN